MRKSRNGITIVEAVVISAITVTLGFALLFIASGWAQVFMLDLTEKTDEYVQSFRSLLLVENINYTESKREVIVRNVSKWDISLTIKEIEILENGMVIKRIHEHVTLERSEYANLPLPVDCEHGKDLTIRIKYIPTALFEKSYPIFVTERNFTCPISKISTICELPSRWVFVDVVDPVTSPSGEFSEIYPIVWVRAPLSSSTGEEYLELNIRGEVGDSSGSSLIEFPSLEKIPIKIWNRELRPPYDIILEDIFFPKKFEFGGFVEDNEVRIHVSGITLIWRLEDMIIEGLIIELGILDFGRYSMFLAFRDCNGGSLFSYVTSLDYTGNLVDNGGWDFIYVDITREFKITDIYSLELSISKIG